MRWVWIDRIIELEVDRETDGSVLGSAPGSASEEGAPAVRGAVRGGRCVAIKNISAAEDVLHDHFPASTEAGSGVRTPPLPCIPHSLVIEGMAQTAGILTGEAGGYREKVILAKVSGASFEGIAGPGTTLRFEAELERFDDNGSACRGRVLAIDSATGDGRAFASIDLMFSHVDRNLAGRAFPAHNFVFDGQITAVLRAVGRGPKAG